MTEHSELIAEIESAEEGSRELDEKIGEALGLEPMWYDAVGYFSDKDAPREHAHYSTNLQDTLDYVVPEGWWVLNSGRKSGRALMILQSLPDGAHGATPQLAGCAAALRARIG